MATTLAGCATKGDMRDLQDEITSLAAQQRQALASIEGLNLAVQDTLRGQSDALVESRGDIVRRLRLIEEQLTTLQELTGQNQRALTLIRDLLESQRASGMGPTRTDTPPGQAMDLDLQPQPTAGGAEETYNAALTQLQRGQLSTARMAFQQFLRDYPNHRLAPDAHFYLADILAQENRPDQAIQEFLRIPELFPGRDKVPEAYYRVGVLYARQRKLDDARRYLELVINSYPESGAAVLAREELDRIG